MKSLPLALVVLLLTATLGVGAVVPAPRAGPDPPTDDNPPASQQVRTTQQSSVTTNGTPTDTLAIPSSQVDRTEIRRQHVDLGPAVGFDTAAMTETIATDVIKGEINDAGNDTQRRGQLKGAVADLETVVKVLKQRNAAAIQAFAAGDHDSTATLQELAMIGHTADRLRDRIEVLEAQSENLDTDSTLPNRLQTLTYELRTLDGPVREHAADIYTSERSPGHVFIQSGNGSIIISSLTEDKYIREVYYSSNRENEQTQISSGRALEVAAETYPLFWNRSDSRGSTSLGAIAFVSLEDADSGSIETFIDGTTEKRYVEYKEISLNQFKPAQRTTQVQNGLRVTVERSYVGGPLRTSVVDEDTGQPINATVQIGQNGQESRRIGSTDRDKPVWALTPDDQFQITAITEDNSAAIVEITPRGAGEPL